jgi:hypothetical protein
MKKNYVKSEARSRAMKPGDVEAGSRFAQRRSVPRYPFSAHAIVLDPLSRTERLGITSDISLSGCYIESSVPLPENSIVRIEIKQSAETFESWGRVTHVEIGLGMGIAFFEIPVSSQAIVKKWIAKAERLLDGEKSGTEGISDTRKKFNS